MILDKIDELLKEVQTLSAKNAEEVEQLRLKYLSKKGEITALMNDFRNVAADEKKAKSWLTKAVNNPKDGADILAKIRKDVADGDEDAKRILKLIGK